MKSAVAKFWRQRKPRERALALVCVVAVAGAIVDTSVFAPQRARLAGATREVAAARLQLDRMQKLAARHAEQGDAASQERLLTLQSRRDLAEAAIRDAQVDLVTPQQMPGHLATLLTNQTRLRVLAAQSQPPVPFATHDEAGAGQARTTQLPTQAVPTGTAQNDAGTAQKRAAQPEAPTLYQHGIELTIEGRYLDLVAWLDTLERAPRRMYWRELDMKVNANGVPVTRVALFTLSQDATWMKL